MTFAVFEQRVAAVPDLELNHVYWNQWMPETSLLWFFVFVQALNRLAPVPAVLALKGSP